MEHHSFISTLIFSAINFAIFLFIVYKFLMPKLIQAVERKSAEVLSELLESEKELKEAKRIYEEAEIKRRKAEEEAEKIKKEVISYAEAECERILKEAESFAKKKEEDLEKLVSVRVNEARIIIQRELVDLIVKLASEKIKKLKTAEDIERFFAQMRKEIEKINRV